MCFYKTLIKHVFILFYLYELLMTYHPYQNLNPYLLELYIICLT